MYALEAELRIVGLKAEMVVLVEKLGDADVPENVRAALVRRGADVMGELAELQKIVDRG